MDSILFWLVPVASVLALCFAYYFHKQMMKESEGTSANDKNSRCCAQRSYVLSETTIQDSRLGISWGWLFCFQLWLMAFMYRMPGFPLLS